MQQMPLTPGGEAQLADVSHRQPAPRVGRAEGCIAMPPVLVGQLTSLKKGNGYEVARLAGIMAAKKTADLIPLCHAFSLDNVAVQLTPDAAAGRVYVAAEARAHSKTATDMEALTAVTVALLTLYDMGKAAARGMEIGGLRILPPPGVLPAVNPLLPGERGISGSPAMKLTHLNEKGEAHMVDVGAKAVTLRIARAAGHITLPAACIAHLSALNQGNGYEIARLAGITGARKTSDLIPLCHGLALDHVSLLIQPDPARQRVAVTAEARCTGRTGIELEALVAVCMALLTLCSLAGAAARDGRAVLGGIGLLYKSGGKSGTWTRDGHTT